MRQNWIRAAVGALILCLLTLHVVGREFELLSRLEALTYDMRVRLTMPQTVDERIVILDIDERSLSEQGRWPWGRDKIARLVNLLFDKYQVNTLGFDVVFAEPDTSSGVGTLERLAQGELKNDPGFQAAYARIRPTLDNDAQFAQALRGRRTVLGFIFSDGAPSGVLPTPVLTQKDFRFLQPGLPVFATYNGNLDTLQKSAADGGHFVPFVDPDGVIRRVPLLMFHQQNYYQSLSLGVLRAALGGGTVEPVYPDESKHYAPEWLKLKTPKGELQIPVDAKFTALVPYRGGVNSFRYVPITDVLKGRLPVADLAGKIVIVGTTAPGLRDQRATPVEGNYPGVEVHANLISGMLDGTLKHQPSYTMAIELLILLTLGALMIFLVPRLSPLMAAGGTLGLVALLVGGNLLLWQQGLVVPLAASLVLLAFLFALNMFWGFFVESRSKRQFTELFGQYVPPELVDEMARNPESYSMEGRRAELSVLFSDIRGFTTISEGMQPEELANLMNEYLGAMTDVVQTHRGTLDKYIGDAIMAFWGAPIDDPQHARNAVLTALDMQRALVPLNKELSAKGRPHIAIGVGVNTGMMTVGDMGSPVRKAYTVLGDSVNLASRLEGITKTYGVGVVVGEATREQLRKEFVFRELDRVRVKGKEEPVAIFEPIGLEGEVNGEALETVKLWNTVLRAYRSQDWDQAELQLLNLSRMSLHPLYALYSERIAYYRQHPPGEGWDGVTTFETK